MVTRRRPVRPRAVDDEGLTARLQAGDLAAFDEQRATAAWQVEHVPEPVRTPDELLAAAHAREVLERALAALAPDDRELLLLVAVEGLRPQDAAEVLGVRPEALRKRLERARGRLRGLIDRATAAQAPTGDER